MKKTALLFGMIIGINLTFLAQSVDYSKPELESILCKQWEIEYAMINNMKIGQKPGASDFDFKFKSNGTYDLIKENSTDVGEWVYETDKKYIELSIKGKITSRIEFISADKLILSLVSGKDNPSDLPSIKRILNRLNNTTLSKNKY